MCFNWSYLPYSMLKTSFKCSTIITIVFFGIVSELLLSCNACSSRSSSTKSSTVSSLRDCKLGLLYKSNTHSNELDVQALDAINLGIDLAKTIISSVPVINVIAPILDATTDIVRFFIPDDTIQRAIDVSLSRERARDLYADMQTVKNRIAGLKHAKSMETKTTELTVALNTCERVLHLFQDSNYPLRQDALNSPLYGKAFAALYISVARLLVTVRPGYRDHVAAEMRKMNVLLDNVVGEFTEKRVALGQTIQTAFNYDNPGQIRDRLTYETANLYAGGTLKDCKRAWANDVSNRAKEDMRKTNENVARLLSELGS